MSILSWCRRSLRLWRMFFAPFICGMLSRSTRNKIGRVIFGRDDFFSCALDDAHLMAAIRYVENNPVRAGLVERAEDYPWSSAAGHCGLRQDEILTDAAPLEGAIEDWRKWLRQSEKPETIDRIRRMTDKGFHLRRFPIRQTNRLRRSLKDRPPRPTEKK